MAAIWGYAEPLRILCTREFQISIKESFHAELKAAIASEPWLDAFYDVGTDYLRGPNGTQFIFRGLRHNVSNIKSLAKVDLTIVEEAEDVGEHSWTALEATVFRQPKSELWAIWNPKDEGSAVDNRFRQNPPDNALIAEVNWNDNPWFPEGLDKLRRREQERLDPATYAHIWEGAYLLNSDSQILANKWRVKEFEPGPDWNGPYHGIDWGFSQDPTAATKSWIHDDVLYVEREAGGVQIETPDIPSVVSRGIPGIDQYEVLADNARPETISQVRRCGLPRCVAAKKWSGSVEDGIQYLRGFKEIIIHPRCKETIREARLYSYKVDDRSGQILPKIVDSHNHYIDSLRYAHDKMIRKRDRTVTMLKPKGF
jgi:phage terminase large subunit